MAVFTKGTKTKLPRCEATANQRQRCQFSGKEYVDGKWVCGVHKKKMQEAK